MVEEDPSESPSASPPPGSDGGLSVDVRSSVRFAETDGTSLSLSSVVRGELDFELPDHEQFEQQVNQADHDRDPFAIALFEVKPFNHDYSKLLTRLSGTIQNFASPSTHVAYLGGGRLAILSRTTDSTQQWVAPVATALQVALDEWFDDAVRAGDGVRTQNSVGDCRSVLADLVGSIDVSDLAERPRLVSGAARGLSQQVWLNAEVALANAYVRQLSFVEYRGSDIETTISFDGRPAVVASPRALTTAGHRSHAVAGAADDDRLVVMSHRLQPVDRPEPEWLWLRLEPGLQPPSNAAARAIDQAGLTGSEQAMLEVWLANQVGPMFNGDSTQLRVTIPITAEAGRARSFAQRIFPILEQHRIPPSRLVLEIETAALVAEPAPGPGGELTVNGSQPSVRRFVEDAAAMDVAVTVSNFDGGWSSWRTIHDLPISYIKPWSDIVYHAGAGDDGAIRALVVLGNDADSRGIELIVPEVESDMSPDALAQIGFVYQEGPATSITRSLGASSSWGTSAVSPDPIASQPR